jgi:hypothetical protein
MESAEENFKVVTDYIERNMETFLKLRQSFGLKENIGLGSSPYFHEIYGWGRLVPTKTRKGELLIPKATFFGLSNDPTLPVSEARRIYVPIQPSGKRKKFLVSFYPRQGPYEGGGLERRALEPSGEVFQGLISHELSEYILNFSKESIKPNFKKVIESIKSSDSDTTEQSRADVLGSLHGYKPQVLAQLNLHLDCLQSYQDFEGGHGALYRAPHEVIREIKKRINLVEKHS